MEFNWPGHITCLVTCTSFATTKKLKVEKHFRENWQKYQNSPNKKVNTFKTITKISGFQQNKSDKSLLLLFIIEQ